MDIGSVSSILTAMGALGTASFGLVDATKVLGGGISLAGLGDVEKALLPLFGGTVNKTDTSTPFAYGSVFANLKAKWINGVALNEQKANAIVLVKLSLNANTAACLAKVTDVNPDILAEIAVAKNLGAVLTREETDVLNKFETTLSIILDQAFQRADQRYRNSAKFLAGVISVGLAILGGAILSSGSIAIGQFHGTGLPFWNTGNFWLAFLIGLLAMPLAPIVKDITSALQAGAIVAQKTAAK